MMSFDKFKSIKGDTIDKFLVERDRDKNELFVVMKSGEKESVGSGPFSKIGHNLDTLCKIFLNVPIEIR